MATYYLFQQEDGWQMRTEFAWSLRNALVKTFPYLDEQKSQISDSDYTDCVLDYLEINLEITLDGKEFDYNTITQIPGTHGHSFAFLLEISGPLEGVHLKIQNDCLTELYRKQKNHVTIKTKRSSFDRLFTNKIRQYSFEIS